MTTAAKSRSQAIGLDLPGVTPIRPAYRLAARMSRVKASVIGEALKLVESPDVLSFAGGLPAPELFPVSAIADAHARVLRDGASLQYSTTEGYAPLREWVAGYLSQRGVRAKGDDILMTSGSQQGIDLLGKVLLDPGDRVLVENPSYLAALQSFRTYEADIRVVGSDDHGMNIDDVARFVERETPKFVYVVPNFGNPTGTTLSLERRRALVRLAQRRRFLIVEDDPYGELRYRGEAVPSLAALDDSPMDDRVVVSLGSFSKTIAPGLRVGWAHGPTSLLRSLALAKQTTDLHTGTLSQRAISAMLETFDLDAHLATLRHVYGERGEAMQKALAAFMPDGMTWTRPDGGLFVWVALPQGHDGARLLSRALEHKVAFVPGSPFFAVDPRPECIRLNYTSRPPELIREGMRRLGSVIRATPPLQ